MLKIIAGPLIDVITAQGWDSSGQPELQVTVAANGQLESMLQEIKTLRIQVDQMLAKSRRDDELCARHPGLQDLRNQYLLVYKLVEEEHGEKL